MNPDLNHLLQEVVNSFSKQPNVKVRYISFNRADDLGRALLTLGGSMIQQGHGHQLPIRTPITDLVFDAVGHDLQSKKERIQEALNTLDKIISGESTKYKTLTLLVVDLDQKILRKIQDHFKSKCSILGWKWSNRDGLVDTYEFGVSITSGADNPSTNAEDYYNMGNKLQQDGRIEEAISSYQEAIRLNPEYAKAHNDLGELLFEQEQLNDAISSFQEALRINPNIAKTHYNIGFTLFKQMKQNEAIEHLQNAIQMSSKKDNDYYLAHAELGMAFYGLEQSEKALHHLTQFMMSEKGRSYEETKQLARDLIRKFEKRNQEYRLVHEIPSTNEIVEEAIQNFQKLEVRTVQVPNFFPTVGSVEYRCSNCNRLVSKTVKECPHCKVLIAGIRCNKCKFVGSELDFANDNCPKCGSTAISRLGNIESGSRSTASTSKKEKRSGFWIFLLALFGIIIGGLLSYVNTLFLLSPSGKVSGNEPMDQYINLYAYGFSITLFVSSIALLYAQKWAKYIVMFLYGAYFVYSGLNSSTSAMFEALFFFLASLLILNTKRADRYFRKLPNEVQ